jgi:predicted nucleic acid-binding protein
MPKESEGVFIDANVLIYSTFDDFEREKHVQCTESLNKMARSGRALFVSTQVLREFFATATNGTIFKKPLTPKQATRQMRDFLKLFSLVHEKETTLPILMDLLDKYAVSRQKIHDMNIVSTMIDNGIFEILTFNVKDFQQISEISLHSFK